MSVAVLALVACKTKYVDKPGTTDSSGDTTTDTTHVDPPDIRFVPHVIGEPPNPTWGAVADFDDDGNDEIVVSALGTVTAQEIPPGEVMIYSMGGSIEAWDESVLAPTSLGIEYPGRPTPYDVDRDGDLDVLLPSGGALCAAAQNLCGAIRWFENRGNLVFAEHILFDGAPFYYTAVAMGDVDGDGTDDLIAASEFQQGGQTQTHLFLGTGGGNFEQIPVIAAEGGGAIPALSDVDGDDDLDILTGETFNVSTSTSFAWYENVGTGFQKHEISHDFGPGYQIDIVKNLLDSGGPVAIATNHTNTQRYPYPDTDESVVLLFDIPADPTSAWTPTVISEGIVALPDVVAFPHPAPGTWTVGDADGDGDDDVVVAGEGDPNVYLLDNDGGTFTTRILASGIGQSGIAGMEDFDDDGDLEMAIYGQIDSKVYVVERVLNEE